MALVGLNGAIGAGLESTYGTAASRTAWWSLISEGLKAQIQQTPRPNLRRNTGGVARSHYTQRKNVGGDFEILAQDEGIGLLLHAAMGASASASNASLYDHTYTLADELPSLSLEVARGEGRQSVSAESELFTGCIINRLGVSLSAHDIARVSATVLAQDSAGRTSLPTVTYSEGVELHADDTTLTWDGNSLSFRSIDITLDNGHVFRDRAGAATTARPTRVNDRTVSARVTLDHVSSQLYNAMLASTEGDLVLTTTIGDNEVVITLHNTLVTVNDAPVSGQGLIAETAEFMAQSSASDTGMTAVITNSQSSATAG